MESVQSQGSDRYSLSSMRSEFDVFLSFRGPDARYGIVDHLYECMTVAGLRVFKDDEEIRRGEVIGGELKRAILGSRVYAVIFSRNYASSAWCLRELDMMVDLCGGSNIGGKIILPIFYGADPADIKLRTKLYREALDKHKGRHGHDIVKKWEEALKTVGGISGWDDKAIQGEGRFVRLIVQDIVVKLRIKDQSLPDHLTGIDDRVFDVLNLLDCDSSGVRLVVLHGMGGIGKTTLARVVFNNLSSQFEGTSFISNVRESAMGHGGIAKLQNKLSGDILGGQYTRSCNFDDGYGEMIHRIQGKRMLLVLDDVDQFSQLEKLLMKNPEDTLGTGSRVIITTRDKSVCNRFVPPGSELLHFYEMEKMDDNHALQLFSRRAFGTDEPPEDYLCLSKQVVKTTGNLPLALEVIAGHLCCQSKELWEDMLKKLKNIHQKEVFNILKVSYDGLDCNEKEIFLDIACFQQGEMPRKYADYLWEARDLYPKCGVKVLINKSLIKIDSYGKFWIHDQLRNMGREIIRSEGDERPERRTRLWDREDALKIVLQKLVSKKIIAMNLGRHDEAHEFSDENFSGLSKLSFLNLNGTKLIGDFRNIRESLLWLSWCGRNIKLNSNFFKMRSLVVLRIIGIKGGWRGGEKLMMPNLRVLEFRRSDMTTSPDLSCCLKLEIIDFFDCFNLKEIHHSVGKLESLTYMRICWCPSLRSLPKELCWARALRELIVAQSKIEEVPESIGRLKYLRTLFLSYNKIRRLPTSICDLTNLLVLEVADNPLYEGISKEIGRLLALVELNLSYTNIRSLPATVSQLTSLKSFRLVGCEMLEELRGLPTSLTVLDASDCPLDEGILEEIVRLSALEELNLSGSKIRFLLVNQLTSLKFLKLEHCEMLRELRGLPTSLTVLNVLDCPLDERILEEIVRLSALEELDLSGSKIRFLPATISQLMSLKSLKLDGCHMLQEVRGLPTSLTYFSFSWATVKFCEEIFCSKADGTRTIMVSELGFLSKLKTLGWSFPDMASPQTRVVISDFTSTEMDLGGLYSLPNLTELSIRDSGSLLGVSNIGRSRRGLRSLEFIECRALVEIPGLEQLELLEELRIHQCPSICRIHDLLGMKRLKKVSIWDCSSLLCVPRLMDECDLGIDGCDKLSSFRGRYSEYEGESSHDYGEFEARYSEYEGVRSGDYVEFEGRYSEDEGVRSGDYGEFEGRYSEEEGVRSAYYGEFEGRYSEYEGERSAYYREF